MSSQSSKLDVPFQTPSAGNSGAPKQGKDEWQGLRHDLVDAQVETLRMYIEKQPPERFVVALDRLIECTRASFRQEEDLMECLTSMADPRHRARHDKVIAQLESLRNGAKELDRGRLLAQLIVVDRELNSHLSSAVRAPLPRQPERPAAASPATRGDALAHH